MRLLCSVLFTCIMVLGSYAQKPSYFKRLFVDAEFYVLYEEYMEALPLYLEIYRTDKENSNINHRIGQCYLNIPNQKHKAIKYFKKALKRTIIDSEYKQGHYSERNAPLSVYRDLGAAYRIKGDFPKAYRTFHIYDSLLKENSSTDPLLEREIQHLNIAEKLMASPVDVEFINLGNKVNSGFANIFPCVDEADSVLIFTSKLRFYDAVFMSRKKRDGIWSGSINLTAQLGLDGNLSCCALSADSKTMYMVLSDFNDLNVYTSRFDNGKWNKPEKLDRHINSRFAETNAFPSKDGKHIFFASDRDGGFGGFDIYVSHLTEKGWSKAENLGANINSEGDEMYPVLGSDSTLYFSSDGTIGMGGFDLYKAQFKDSHWEVENMGYPINTTDDDVFFYPAYEPNKAYISKFDESGFGDHDIYMVVFK